MTEQLSLNAYWANGADQLLGSLGSSAQGLDQATARRRLEEVGYNLLQEKEKPAPLAIFLSQFKSPIVLILLFATAVSVFVQEWVDAVIILAIVFGSALLSFTRNTTPAMPWRDSRRRYHTKPRCSVLG